MYANEQKAAPRPRLTVPGLRKMKAEGRRIVSVTAYDAGFARTVDSAGLDFVLVGDSLGMVCQGHDSTLPVTVADIAYHVACVARGLSSALLVADLPFQAESATQGVPIVAVPMQKSFGFGVAHKRFEHLTGRQSGGEWDRPACEQLRKARHIGVHAKEVGRGWGAQPPDTCEDFVEDDGYAAPPAGTYELTLPERVNQHHSSSPKEQVLQHEGAHDLALHDAV